MKNKKIIILTLFLIAIVTKNIYSLNYTSSEKEFVIVKHHIPVNIACGYLATADITYVKSFKNKELKIITLCGIDEGISIGDTVQLIRSKKPSFGVTLPNDSLNFNYPLVYGKLKKK